MKKILFCINSLGLGGQEKQLLDLVSNLKNTYKSVIYVLKNNLERIDYIKDFPEIYKNDKKSFKFFYSFLSINRIIKTNIVDIVFAFDLGSSIYALFPAKFKRVKKFFAQFNGSFINNAKLKIFLKIFYPFYKKIICNSFAGADYLRMLGIPKEKLEVIHQGFNFEAMEKKDYFHISLKNELRIDRDTPLIGCVGKLNEDKEPITFLKAAKIVHWNFPKAHFCIIGDGDQRKMLNEFINVNNMKDYFYLLPRRQEAPWLIKDFDIGVLSSKNEGLPNVLLEYMFWKKPIVTTDAGDSGKVVRDGLNGFVVKRGDYEAMADRLIYFLKNREEAKRFGIRGREVLEKDFSISNQIEKYLKLFSG